MEAHERNWLDGRGLAEWLEHRGCTLTKTTLGHHERAVRHWRDGGACSVFQADRVLTKLNIHLHEVPDDLWLEKSPMRAAGFGAGRQVPFDPATKREAVSRVLSGRETQRDVAQSIGCSPKAVRNWIESAA